MPVKLTDAVERDLANEPGPFHRGAEGEALPAESQPWLCERWRQPFRSDANLRDRLRRYDRSY